MINLSGEFLTLREGDYKHFNGKIEVGLQQNIDKLEYETCILKCNTIVITLLTDLQNYVIDRENPSFMDTLLYNTDLTSQRISLVAKPLIASISNNIIQNFDHNKYLMIVFELESKIKQNDNLTKAYKVGVGKLEENMKTVLNELKKHSTTIINYRKNLSLSEVIGEELLTVLQKGNKIFGDFIFYMEH